MFIVLPMCAGGLLAPVAAIICKKYSARIFCIISSIIGGISYILANYAVMEDSSLKDSFLNSWSWYISLITVSGAFFGGIL